MIDHLLIIKQRIFNANILTLMENSCKVNLWIIATLLVSENKKKIVKIQWKHDNRYWGLVTENINIQGTSRLHHRIVQPVELLPLVQRVASSNLVSCDLEKYHAAVLSDVQAVGREVGVLSHHVKVTKTHVCEPPLSLSDGNGEWAYHTPPLYECRYIT